MAIMTKARQCFGMNSVAKTSNPMLKLSSLPPVILRTSKAFPSTSLFLETCLGKGPTKYASTNIQMGSKLSNSRQRLQLYQMVLRLHQHKCSRSLNVSVKAQWHAPPRAVTTIHQNLSVQFKQTVRVCADSTRLFMIVFIDRHRLSNGIYFLVKNYSMSHF